MTKEETSRLFDWYLQLLMTCAILAANAPTEGERRKAALKREFYMWLLEGVN